MAAKYWLKLYYEMLDDPKIGRLTAALKWRFVECLLVAGETDEDGFLPEVGEMAWRVREDGERYETELNELTKAGLLSKADGRYFVTNYSKRQGAVSGAERVAKYRERQKKQEYYEPETEQERNGNDIVTNRYTDIDKIREDVDETEPTETDPILSLAGFFTNESGILPGRSNWDDAWQTPLELILKNAGTEDAARNVLTNAVKFARNGGSKKYTITSPKSLTTIIANMPAGDETPGTIKVGAR